MADDVGGVSMPIGADTTDQPHDINHSPAFSFLDGHCAAGELSSSDAHFYKEKYQSLHEYVLEKYEREKELLRRAKQLNQDLLAEKIKLGKLTIRRHDDLQSVSVLEKERDKGGKELTEATERDAMLQYSLVEVSRECEDLREELSLMRKANSDLVEPELKKMKDACQQLEKELEVMNTACDADKKLKDDLLQHSETLHEDTTNLTALILEEKQTVSKLKTDPARIKKQSDVVQKAVENMRGEIERADSKVAACDHELGDQASKRKELVEVGRDITRKLELHRATIQQREREVDEVGLSLEMECTTHQDLLTRRVEMDLLAAASKTKLKEANDELVRVHKEFEAEKRKLKKRIQQCDMMKATLPQLKLQLNDGQHLATSYKTENKQLKRHLQELQQEVDIYIASYLSQETTEKSKRIVLEKNRTVVKELEQHISLWSVEEAKQVRGLLSHTIRLGQ
jgi:chromosome segregation ATPase